MNQILEKIYKEIQSLRQDLAVVLPPESINEYRNQKLIIQAYKQAIGQHPNLALADNEDN